MSWARFGSAGSRAKQAVGDGSTLRRPASVQHCSFERRTDGDQRTKYRWASANLNLRPKAANPPRRLGTSSATVANGLPLPSHLWLQRGPRPCCPLLVTEQSASIGVVDDVLPAAVSLTSHDLHEPRQDLTRQASSSSTACASAQGRRRRTPTTPEHELGARIQVRLQRGTDLLMPRRSAVRGGKGRPFLVQRHQSVQVPLRRISARRARLPQPVPLPSSASLLGPRRWAAGNFSCFTPGALMDMTHLSHLRGRVTRKQNHASLAPRLPSAAATRTCVTPPRSEPCCLQGGACWRSGAGDLRWRQVVVMSAR